MLKTEDFHSRDYSTFLQQDFCYGVIAGVLEVNGGGFLSEEILRGADSSKPVCKTSAGKALGIQTSEIFQALSVHFVSLKKSGNLLLKEILRKMCRRYYK